MVDKYKEAWYVKSLRSRWQAFPSGDIIPSERPDFLVSDGNRSVGIEITEFFLPQEPGEPLYQEAESIREHIVSRALSHYRTLGGPPLLIDIEFSNDVRLTKRDVDATARALAERIVRLDFVEDEQPGWRQRFSGNMPRGIVEICGGKYRSVENWDFGGGGWVRPCTHDHIQGIIARKAPLYAAYRQTCDEAILVIVFTAFAGPPTDVPVAVLEEVFQSPFDSTLAFFVDVPSVFELRRAEAAV